MIDVDVNVDVVVKFNVDVDVDIAVNVAVYVFGFYRVFFFSGPPPKKLKYGKPRLGKVRCI